MSAVINGVTTLAVSCRFDFSSIGGVHIRMFYTCKRQRVFLRLQKSNINRLSKDVTQTDITFTQTHTYKLPQITDLLTIEHEYF